MRGILSQLKNELKNQLHFFFSNLENLSRPGDRKYHVKDTIRFTVFARNDAEVLMKNIEGEIKETEATKFQLVPFSIPSFEPGEEKELATITAEIISDPIEDIWPDVIGTVEVTAEADLSNFKFEDHEIIAVRIHPEEKYTNKA